MLVDLCLRVSGELPRLLGIGPFNTHHDLEEILFKVFMARAAPSLGSMRP